MKSEGRYREKKERRRKKRKEEMNIEKLLRMEEAIIKKRGKKDE